MKNKVSYEDIQKIAKQTIEELEKSGKPFYPLYYKNIFIEIAKEKNKDLLEKIDKNLLCLKEEKEISEKVINKTEESIETIEYISEDIKQQSENITKEIKSINNENIKKICMDNYSKLSKQIEYMQKTISALKEELDKAYNEIFTDELTQTLNRKAFEKDIKEIIKKGQNKTLNTALCIIDFDDFKKINDTYGHLIGDFVLRKAVEILKKHIRREDTLYRIGGDEFVLIMNNVNINTVKKTMNNIFNIIKKIKLKYKDYIISLSFSIGITMHKKGDTEESFIQRADKAVYEAKKEKNRYIIY